MLAHDRGGSNRYSQSMFFFKKNKKTMYTPVNASGINYKVVLSLCCDFRSMLSMYCQTPRNHHCKAGPYKGCYVYVCDKIH